MQEAHNIDSALVQDMSSRMNSQAPVQPAADVSAPIKADPLPQENVPHGTIEQQNSAENEQTQPPTEARAEPENTVENANKAAENPHIDEYGNPTAKPKMYTEEEFNQRLNEGIRQRLARGKVGEQQPSAQQVRNASDEFKVDPNSEDSWEIQLESFIEKTIDKRQAKMNERQWREQEAIKQAEFESKFTSGMSKYDDFHQVVQPMVQQGKVTDAMMFAARGLDNPAAFVYGAAKMHPQELERIARIADPYAQAAEVGRLHEKMVKSKNITSGAPRPLDAPRSDMPGKVINMPSLDERINQHAASKQARK